MGGLPEPDWYLDNVLVHAEPGPGVRSNRGPARDWTDWWARQTRGSRDPAVQLARSQGFVVGVEQLRDLGWRRHDDRRELRRGTWTRVGPGSRSPITVDRDTDNDHLRRRRQHALHAAAAALARSDHVISGRSAATLHGLPTLELPALPELTAAESVLGRRDRAHVYGATLRGQAITTWFGTPVTIVARTLADLARHDRRDGLMAADAALRESLASRAEIQHSIDDAVGWPGIRQARAILALATPLAESPLESLLRLCLHDDGFPPPQLQVEIADSARGQRYRVDLLYPDARLIIEADGRAKYIGDALWREKQRETRLRALGYRVERVLWNDVLRYWPQTRARLRGLLAG